MFEVGEEVEISFDGEGYTDAWFPATIFEKLKDGYLIVEYHWAEIGKRSRPRKVTIDPVHVRPSPPLLKSANFDLLEKVDASFNNGWWSGVITKELEDSRYVVFFKNLKKEQKFHQSEIRRHMEWKNGKWINSLKDILIPSPDSRMQESQICTKSTTMALQFGSSGNGKDNSKENTSFSLSSMENLPLKNLKEGTLVLAPCLAPEQENMPETPHNALKDASVSPTFGNTISSAKQPASEDMSANNSYWKKRIQRNRRKVQRYNPTLNSKNRRRKSQTRELSVQVVEDDNVNEEPTLGIVLALACTKFGTSRCKTGSSAGKTAQESYGTESLKLIGGQEQLSNHLAVANIKADKQSQPEVSMQKRKRGRPRKILIKSPQTHVADEMTTKDGAENEVGSHRIVEDQISEMEGSMCNAETTACEILIDCPSKQKSNSVGKMKKTSTKVLDGEVSKVTIIPCEKTSSKRGRRRSADQKIASQFQVSLHQHASRKNNQDSNGIVNEASKVNADLPINNKLDDEPLSKLIKVIQTPSAVDGSEVSPTRMAEQCVETSKQNDITVPSGQKSLPFAKNAVLWKTIESMDVFQRMPQNPHFKPLESFKESSREGLAIGFMVTFSSVVDKASRLQFSDLTSSTDDLLETLVDLERHGFDVRAVRDRVTGLVSVKEKQAKLLGHVEEIKSQIANHKTKLSRMNEEVSEIHNQIRNLQEKLSAARSAKEMKDHQIATLRSRVEELKEGIKSIEGDFEGLASAPL